MKKNFTRLTVLSIIFINCIIAGAFLVEKKILAETSQKTEILLGIDNIDQYLKVFEGKRVGLITNATGYNSQLVSSISILQAKTNLVALYAPEHGVRGNILAGEFVDNYLDSESGLTVYSLYGKNKKPSKEILNGIDILAFDIQDVGARFYTYIYTMAYAMQACAEQNKEFIVFDRPNPVGGEMVEGGIVNDGYESFIGMYKIPIRHGMTVGELAKLFNEEFKINCKLTVIPMVGWKREMFWQDTGLHWLNTSPNIPTSDTAIVYSGTGMLGDAGISVGIGTTRPFEYIGLQTANGDYLAYKLNSLKLPGVIFLPITFNVKSKIYSGVQIIVTDKRQYLAVRTAMAIFYNMKNFYSNELRSLFDFQESGRKHSLDLSSGSNWLRLNLYNYEDLMNIWDQEALQFKKQSKKYYLY